MTAQDQINWELWDRIKSEIREVIEPLTKRVDRIEQEHGSCFPEVQEMIKSYKAGRGFVVRWIERGIATGALLLLAYLARLFLRPEVLAAIQRAGGQ